MIDFNPYAAINTETKLCDFCVKILKSDLKKLDSALGSAKFYYGSQNTTVGQENFENLNKRVGKQNELIHEPRLRKDQHSRNNGFGKRDKFDKKLREVRSSDNQDSRELSTDHGKETQVKKNFKHPVNSSLPFIYDGLNSYFSARCRDHLPIFGPTIGPDQIRTLDEKAITDYTSVQKSISSNMQYFLLGSILNSFRVLGIDTPLGSQSSKFSPLSVRTSVNLLSKNTNAGAPTFGRKNDENVRKSTIKWVYDFLRKPTFYRLGKRFIKENIRTDSGFNDLMTLPTHIMYRFQIRPEVELGRKFLTKLRQVWCTPFSVVTLEAMFFNPILDRIKSNAMKDNPIFPIGLNNKQLGERVSLPLHRAKRRFLKRKVESLDFSKFDRTIEAYFTSFFFTICGSQLQFSERKYKAFSCLRFYTCFTPFIYKDNVYMTRKGVCSGSFTTNFRDTIVNLAMIICAIRIKYNHRDISDKIIDDFIFKFEHCNYNFRQELRTGSHYVDVNHIHVYGDDGIALEDEEFFKIHKFLCDEYSLNITYKENENIKDNSFYFLGRFWNEEGRPWQTYSYIISHIMFRTRFYKKEDVKFDISEKLNLYRVLSICLPLENGREFLDTVLYDWKPYRDFLKEKHGFYLLKEWPNENYVYIPRERVFNYEY